MVARSCFAQLSGSWMSPQKKKRRLSTLKLQAWFCMHSLAAMKCEGVAFVREVPGAIPAS